MQHALLQEYYRRRHKAKPGETVLNAPPEIREQLKDLKASDICRWRPDLLKIYLEFAKDDREEAVKEQNRKLVADFDRQMQPKISSPGRGIVFLRMD